MKIQKKKIRGGGVRFGSRVEGCQGGCERRIEVGRGGVGSGGGGGGRRRGGVRVDVNEELKFLGKFTKKIRGGGGGGSGGGGGQVGGGCQGGCE